MYSYPPPPYVGSGIIKKNHGPKLLHVLALLPPKELLNFLPSVSRATPEPHRLFPLPPCLQPMRLTLPLRRESSLDVLASLVACLVGASTAEWCSLVGEKAAAWVHHQMEDAAKDWLLAS